MKREEKIGLFLALPALIGLVVFYVLPMIIAGYNSVTFGGTFVGIENYQLTFENKMFKIAIVNTIKFTLIAIPLIMAISLFFAVLLEHKFKGNRIFRLIFLYPLVVPVSATVMVAKIFLTDTGALNTLLAEIGISKQEWLTKPWAFVILVLIYIWKNMGYNIILLLAGLSMIPSEYEEMAKIDGCSRLRFLFNIKFPLLTPVFKFTLLISILNSFKSFRETLLIGGVHPDESIYMIQHFVNNNLANLDYIKVSTTSFVLFALVFLVVLLLYVRKEKH